MKIISEDSKKVAEILRALGHPIRIEIIRFLNSKKNKKISVKQIHENLGLTQVEASRHLIVLKNADVLDFSKEGTNSYYFINNKDFFVNAFALFLVKNVK